MMITRQQLESQMLNLLNPPQVALKVVTRNISRYSDDALRARFNEFVLEILPTQAKEMGLLPVGLKNGQFST